MADCSELAQALSDMALAIGAKSKTNIDGIVKEMNSAGVKVTRDQVVESLILANKGRKGKPSVLAQRLAAIKQEARTDVKLKADIEKLEGFLKTGERATPTVRKAKPQPKAISQLKKVKEGLKNEIRKVDAKAREMKRLENKIAELEWHVEAGTLPSKKARKAKSTDAELSVLKSRIAELQGKIRERTLDQRQIARTHQQIGILKEHLRKGTLPEKTPKIPKGSAELQKLRAERDALRRELGQSPEAVKQRLQKSIESLNEKIKNPQPTARKDPLMTPELERLRFDRDQARIRLQRELEALKPKTLWERIREPFNASRAILTSFDFSAVFRQGGFIAFGNPKRAVQNLPDMFRAFASRKATRKIAEEIANRPNAPLYARSKLHISPVDEPLAALSKREEVYMSRLLDRIAEMTIGKVVLSPVKGSERAYITFLNKLRADTFDSMVGSLSKGGQATQDEIKAIANYVNVATGRGGLGKMEQAATSLNTIFFAPRYVASRFQLLALQPLYKGTTRTRTIIAREYAKYLVGLGALYSTAMLAGFKVESNPNSSDFGKLRIGNSRIDPLSGLSQAAVLTSRVASGKTKSSITGKITPIRGKVPFGRMTTFDVLSTFGRSKLSPQFGFAVDVTTGQNIVGEKVSLGSATKNLFIPIGFQSLVEALKYQDVPTATALWLAEIFGMSLASYGSKQKK